MKTYAGGNSEQLERYRSFYRLGLRSLFYISGKLSLLEKTNKYFAAGFDLLSF